MISLTFYCLFCLIRIILSKMKNYLNFETDIKSLEEELEKLKDPYNQDGLSEVNTKKITQIQEQIDKKLSLLIKKVKTLSEMKKKKVEKILV